MNIVTNNTKVYDYYKDKDQQVSFVDGGYRDVLCFVRDEIHKGCVLLTHPLSGSIKPNETRFKSVVICTKDDYQIDFKSLNLIESSIATFDKFNLSGNRFDNLNISEKVLEDFRTVDFSLLINSLNRGGGY